MARHRRQLACNNPPQDPVGSRQPEITAAADMEAAVVAGEAAPFSQVITFIRRYQETWWLSTEAGWLPVRPPLAAVLDEHAERMRHPASKSASNASAIRAVIELARELTQQICHQDNV